MPRFGPTHVAVYELNGGRQKGKTRRHGSIGGNKKIFEEAIGDKP